MKLSNELARFSIDLANLEFDQLDGQLDGQVSLSLFRRSLLSNDFSIIRCIKTL